jgi:hypothetical protein
VTPSKELPASGEMSVNKPSSVNKSPEKSDRVKNGAHLPGRGESHQQRWIVRASGFPFALPGKVLGIVEAIDSDTAVAFAAAMFGNAALVVEPEHRVNPALEKVVAKAVKGAERRQRHGRSGFARPRRKPLTHPDQEN